MPAHCLGVIATKISLRSLARRLLDLGDEVADLDKLITQLVEELGPGLLALDGVGIHNAGELLVTAGDNPERVRSEAGFAMLCGTSPIPGQIKLSAEARPFQSATRATPVFDAWPEGSSCKPPS